MTRQCMVIRMDDNGNVVLVRDGATRGEAEALAHSLAIHAHKQTYEVLCYGDSRERADLLRLRGVCL